MRGGERDGAQCVCVCSYVVCAVFVRECVGESVVKLRAQSHPNSALPLHPGASDPEHDRTSVTLSRAKHTSRLGMTVLARICRSVNRSPAPTLAKEKKGNA